ncbi:MAG: HlyD family secretion protein, partial [Actinomycetota bacterium]|nr:HlyD family secretion protein [Actinomycetota bacterium]
AAVGRATVVEVVEAPATVSARATATVTSPADGTVAALRVREGQQVHAGQVLLRVESPDARRRLRQALRADAEAASAGTPGSAGAVDLSAADRADAAARRAFARARRAALRIPPGPARQQALSALRVSQSQYQAARASADQAAQALAAGLGSLSDAVTSLSAAQRVQTRAAVDAARREVAALTVRAPVAGTVSLSPPAASTAATDPSALLDQLPENLQGQAGDLLGSSGSGSSGSVDAVLAQGRPVSSGQPVLTVTDTSTLSLTAQVDETDVLLVRSGVPASAELDAVPDAQYEAAVTTIDPAPTSSTRGGVTYVVRLSLGRGTAADGSTAPTPRPGMSAVVDLQVRTARDTVAVPAAAVFRDGRRDAVWVVVHGVAKERRVRLGAQGKARVQVLEGLKVGEHVVVRGADQVHDGQHLP